MMMGAKSVNRCLVTAAIASGCIILNLAGCASGNSGGGGTTKTQPPPPAITLTLVGPYNATLEGNNWVVAGIPGFTLLVTGTGFTSTSVVEWNGNALSTQLGSTTGLAATVSSAMVTSPGTATITVVDQASGAVSNGLPFGVASPAAATAGAVQMITVAPDGSPANNDSLVAPSINTTGQYVSFQSAATNLVAGVASGYQEIYERNTCTGSGVSQGCTPSTIEISATYDGSQVDGHSFDSSVTADGRYVAFDSAADNILNFPAAHSICASYAGAACVYVRDTCMGVATGCQPQTVLVSVDENGNPTGGGNPAISPDGRFVAFNSTGSGPGINNVYLRDTCNNAPAGCTPNTIIISQSSSGQIGTQKSDPQAVNSGGRFVAFQSYATNLVSNDTNQWSDIFLRDTCVGAGTSCSPSTTRESVGPDGAQGNNSLDYEVIPSISSDGRFIAWASDATNMVSQNVNGFANIYLRDTCFGVATGCTPATSLASIGNDGSIPNYGQNNQSMSSDGRFVAFASLASNLVPGDTFPAGSWKDIFVHDTCFNAPAGCTPNTVRVSVTNTPSFATQSNATSDFPRISGDGHYIVFMSAATNLIQGITGNGHTMVYLAKTGY